MVQLKSTWAATAVLIVFVHTGLAADILVFRDGRRVEGKLVAVRGDSIEFEPRGDNGTRRYDRSEVRSIQFDDPRFDGRDQLDRRDPYDSRARSAMRERTVNVDSRTRWTDTGIDVRGGQEVIFVATGEVRWGPSRRDGAAGERNSPYNAGRPMADRNAAALIGKIGENGDPFFIGDDRQPFRMRGAGRLYLGINDDYLQDNSGSLRVLISY
jgi:hypothetical protein